MLTKSIRRKPAQVLAVLAAVTSLSGLAEAQQSGMFPLHPIRRERTPCPNEEPIYKLYRNQYYGYFPTQWRKFPDNWSLRSRESPNTAEELKNKPIEGPKPFSPDGEGDEMQGPATPGASRRSRILHPMSGRPLRWTSRITLKAERRQPRRRHEGTPQEEVPLLRQQLMHRRLMFPRRTRLGRAPGPAIGPRLHVRAKSPRPRLPMKAHPTWLRRAMPPTRRREPRGIGGRRAGSKIPVRF